MISNTWNYELIPKGEKILNVYLISLSLFSPVTLGDLYKHSEPALIEVLSGHMFSLKQYFVVQKKMTEKVTWDTWLGPYTRRLSLLRDNLEKCCFGFIHMWKGFPHHPAYNSPTENHWQFCTFPRCCAALSCVWLCATSWTVGRQAPLSIGFSRQEFWSGLSFPPPGYLPNPRIKTTSPIFPTLVG